MLCNFVKNGAVKIWVDADACPVAVRDIISRAAHRRGIETVFVANKALPVMQSPRISFVEVDDSPDAADGFIAENAQSTDLVVTQDIPLAHILVSKNIMVLSPRGVTFAPENIGERISVRNLMQDLRDSGESTGGPRPFGDKERRAFASAFDRALTRLLK